MRKEKERVKERKREKEGDIEAMGRGYIIPALGPSAFAFENKMRKHGPLARSFFHVYRGQGRRWPRRRRSRRNAVVSSEKGRRSFDPSLTGPLLASFSLVTRIPRPSDQIIVLGVDSVPTWKQRDTYTRLERGREATKRREALSLFLSLSFSSLPFLSSWTTPVSVLRNEKSRGRCLDKVDDK